MLIFIGYILLLYASAKIFYASFIDPLVIRSNCRITNNCQVTETVYLIIFFVDCDFVIDIKANQTTRHEFDITIQK